ncbi:MAG: hypothetical protein RL205_508 [Actinomycetota bacterium]
MSSELVAMCSNCLDNLCSGHVTPGNGIEKGSEPILDGGLFDLGMEYPQEVLLHGLPCAERQGLNRLVQFVRHIPDRDDSHACIMHALYGRVNGSSAEAFV